MISELLAITSKTKLLHVPYKGGSQAVQDLMGGQVDFLIDSLPSPLPHIKSGRLRALAVTSAKRVAAIPDVPTLSETLPDFEAISWLGVGCAPAVPSDIAGQLGQALQKLRTDPIYVEKIRSIGAEPEISASPQSFVAFLESERARWKKVAVDARIPTIN